MKRGRGRPPKPGNKTAQKKAAAAAAAAVAGVPKRGRGRPPKVQKAVRAPTPPKPKSPSFSPVSNKSASRSPDRAGASHRANGSPPSNLALEPDHDEEEEDEEEGEEEAGEEPGEMSPAPAAVRHPHLLHHTQCYCL